MSSTLSGDRPDDFRHLTSAEHGVDLGNLLDKVVSVALGQAPGDHEPLARAVLLVLRHLENRVDRFLLRRVDERTRVHDEHIGRRRIVA